MMKTMLLLAPMGSIHTRFNLANIEAIRQLNYKLTIVANFDVCDGPEKRNMLFAEKWKGEGIEVISFPFVRHSLLGNLRLISQLRNFLKERRFDFIHTHTETGGLLLRLCGCVPGKKFYTIHGMSFWKGGPIKPRLVYKPIERFICSGMDANLGMNKEELYFLTKWNKRTAHYVHGVGLNVARMQNPSRSREQMREEFGLAESDKFIASIGELDDNKNHITVIKALATLGRKDFKYVVCGVGPNKDMLLAEAERMGLKDNVILAGYRSDIPDVLNAADIFVFPSFHEGMPVSALEAMACGLPIICSEIRGNVDIIREGDNGYLFQPSDVETLARKLEYLLDDAEKRKVMGLKNKENVKDFSLESVTEELKRIYKSVL